MLASYIKEYAADGFLIHSIKSCNSFSAGQLMMLREVERRTGLRGRSSSPTSWTRATSRPPTSAPARELPADDRGPRQGRPA